MTRPYIICHMMTSVDGRIDCAVMEKLAGNDEYYSTLNELNAPTTLSGRVTAQLEMAKAGKFIAQNEDALNAESFSKKADAQAYTIVVDTKGSLLWENSEPMIIITSETVSKEYLAYLDERNISWIACGKTKIDLARAMEILAEKFHVERLAVVGGGNINAGFLDAGLLDEISILLAPGIDGRGNMTATFDGLPKTREPFLLKLLNVKAYADGAVWLRYQVQNKK